jgi:hypothetical protein
LFSVAAALFFPVPFLSAVWGQVRDLALQLLQQWAAAFESDRATLPAFADAVASLQARGVAFPAPNPGQSAPVFTPPPAMFPDEEIEVPLGSTGGNSGGGNSGGGNSGGNSGGGNSGSNSGGGNRSGGNGGVAARADVAAEDAAGLAKLAGDLAALQEKVKLCREMLPGSPGVARDETLADVVGFLEACQPRMVELVEAGLQGLLGEDLLMTTLQLNDDLAAVLDAERTGAPLPHEAFAPAGSASAAGAPASGQNSPLGEDLLSLLSVAPPGDDEEELVGRRKGKTKPGAAAELAVAALDEAVAAEGTVVAGDELLKAPCPPPAPAVGADSSQPLVVPAAVAAADPFAALAPPFAQLPAADPFGAPEMGFAAAPAASAVSHATPLSALDAYDAPYLAPSPAHVFAAAAQDAPPPVVVAPTWVVAAPTDPFASLVAAPGTPPPASRDPFGDLGEAPGTVQRRSDV